MTSNATDKIKGTANEALGDLEEGIGAAIGSEDWTLAGKMTVEKGRKQRAESESNANAEEQIEKDLVGSEDEGVDEEKRRKLDIDLHPGMNS